MTVATRERYDFAPRRSRSTPLIAIAISTMQISTAPKPNAARPISSPARSPRNGR